MKQAAGRAKHSFTATYLTAKEMSPEEERLIQMGATMLYMAGSDTVCKLTLMNIFYVANRDNIDRFVYDDFCSLYAPQSHGSAASSGGNRQSRWS
jgi:hypothetical protein